VGDKEGDQNILDQDEDRFAESGKGEALLTVISECEHVGDDFHQEGGDAEATAAFVQNDLNELRNFENRGKGDEPKAHAFADEEGNAFGVTEVKFNEKSIAALLADERGASAREATEHLTGFNRPRPVSPRKSS
jgi:hypothetical protein